MMCQSNYLAIKGGPLNTISYDLQGIAAGRIFVRFAKMHDVFVPISEAIACEKHLSS